MEKLNSLNVNDLYKSHEQLENNLKKLMNLIDLYKEKNEQDLDLNHKKNTIVLSPDEEDYLENIIENKVEAIIDASKYNNKLKNSLYKLVNAFKIYDSEFTYSVDKKKPNLLSIQTQTPPKSPILMEQDVQAELNEMNEIIVLEPTNNSSKKKDMSASPINSLNDPIKKGEIIKETKDIAVGDDFTIDDILTNEDDDVFNDEDINTFINSSSDENCNINYDNNDNENILLRNNKILINEDIQVNRTPSKEKHSSTIINPINTKSKKSLKGKNRKKNSFNAEYKSKDDFADPAFLSSSVTSSSPSLSPLPSPMPLTLSSPSLSQDIYLGKSNTQQAVPSAQTQTLFSKQVSSTKDAACQTESYKVVIHGEDYNIPPGYMGHYAVVPLWMIWVIGYYYKKKTKPKSMWRFLASKTPSLLNKSRMQNKIINKVELMN